MQDSTPDGPVANIPLTISNNNLILGKEIKLLQEKNENNEYLIKSKLQERDDAITSLSDQVLQLMKEVKELTVNKKII